MSTIVFAEPQNLLRVGLEYLLNINKISNSIKTAQSGKDLLNALTISSADICIISSTIQDMSLYALIKKIKRDYPGIKVLILANDINITLAKKYVKSGADGYIAKTSTEHEFIESIKKLQMNRPAFPDMLAETMTEEKIRYADSPFDSLSNREMDILQLMLKGRSVKEISDILHLSPKTISTYKGRVFEKLNVNSLVSVYVLACECGLLIREDLQMI